jgi:hypothetical protein
MKTLIIVIMLAITTPVAAQQKPVRQEMFTNGVGIGLDCVVMPFGRILLIGRDNFVGGLKFLHSEERRDGRYSQYEFFEYEKGGFRKTRIGEVSFKVPSSKGFFFHKSPNTLGAPFKLKNFTLYLIAGGREHFTVYFWSRANKVDLRARMAPTPWEEIGEVDLSDARIRWLGYDEKRKWKVIPIQEIWN